MESFRYPALTGQTSVRFVRLMPGTSENIHCELFESDVNDVSFIALSYAWGGQLLDKSITIRNYDKKEMHVTSNLFDALQQIRHTSDSVTLWVDAICIDQENLAERNHQVRQMADIYRGADQVIVWLGKDDESASVAINLIELSAPYATETATTALVTRRIVIEEWQRLRNFLQRDWFKRMWVIQELVLGLKMSGPSATLVMCGRYTITWVNLAHACQWARTNYPAELRTLERATLTDALHKGFDRVLFLHEMAIRGPFIETTSQTWLHWLMSNLPVTRSRKATDPRDKLFALYGLCGRSAIPDYTVTTAEVYFGLAERIATENSSLAFLHEVESSKTLGGPSWVPDWSVQLNRASFRERSDFDASAGFPVFTPVFTGPGSTYQVTETRALRLLGMLADEIEFATEPITTARLNESDLDGNSVPLLVWIWDLLQNVSQLSGKTIAFEDFARTLVTNAHYHNSEQLLTDAKLFWESILSDSKREVRLLFGDSLSDILTRTHLRTKLGRLGVGSSLSFLGTMCREMRAGNVRPSWVTSNRVMAPSTRTYRDLLQKWAKGRVFFTTLKGSMGLGVPGCSKGDQVAIFHSCRTPFVIRKDSRGDAFRFVGESYVHGMMNGEAVRLNNGQRITLV